MSNRMKFLSILIILSIAITLFLVISSNKVAIDKNNVSLSNNKNTAIDMVKLEESYKISVKQILNDYENVINGGEIGKTAEQNNASASAGPAREELSDYADDITRLKNRLLDLKVPVAFKDFHLNFVLAIDKIESYMASYDIKEYNESLAMIKAVKEENPWLD